MKINQLTNHKIRNILIISIVTIVLASVAYFAYVQKHNPSTSGQSDEAANNINYDKPTQEQLDAGTKAKSDNIIGSSSDKVEAPTEIPGGDKKNVQVTITALNQSDALLQVRALIGIVDNTGSCTLTLTSPNQPTVIKTSSTYALASTSTCQGFDVPLTDLATNTTWQAKVTYDSSILTGTATKDVAIK